MLPAIASALARCSLTTPVRVVPGAFISPPAVVSFPAMPCVVPSALVRLPLAVGALIAARFILIALAESLMVLVRAITPHAIASSLTASLVVLGLPGLLRFRLIGRSRGGRPAG
ncbi:hypothetical protein ACQP25_23195 [Microtetraspora malaysiensis]|uniref:hypothetical protein n=1 Tax=Microtetraspora malaysiensis TaxID=161358 RepID=UPI003D8D531C